MLLLYGKLHHGLLLSLQTGLGAVAKKGHHWLQKNPTAVALDTRELLLE